MIKTVKVTTIQKGLYAVAVTIPGFYRAIRALVRDGDQQVWVDALNRFVAVKPDQDQGFILEVE